MDRRKTYPGVRPHGKSIQIDFNWRGQRYRERVALPPTPENLRFASQKRNSILFDIECDKFDFRKHFPNSKKSPGSCETISDALDVWLASKRKECALSTFRDYSSAVEYHLRPKFGERRLDELSTTEVRSWIAALAISPKRISNVLTPLRGIYEDAFLDGSISTNPLSRIRSRAKRPAEPSPLDTDQVEAVIDSAIEPQHATLFQFAFFSGLRTSELIALRWVDVDFHKGVVRVCRAKVRRQLKAPKTSSGHREVKLNSRTLAALESQKKYSLERNEEVFLNPRTGEPWTDDGAIRKTAWRPALKAAGVPTRRLYETRHTYASMMLTLGEEPFWVSQQMGHSSLQQTLKAYARWIPNVNKAGGSKLETFLSQRSHSESANA